MRNLLLASLLIAAGTQAAFAKPKNMTVLLQAKSSETLDLGQTGPSFGDIAINRGLCLNSKTKEQIGSYVVRKIIVGVDIPGGSDERDHLAQYTLPGGTITATGITSNNSGTNLPNQKSERPIVGGTGKYFGARGTSTVTPVEGQPDMLIISLKFK